MAEAPKVAPKGKSDAPLTPETTDVPPLYFAIVSPDDPRAVMDVVAMVPASANTTEPSAYRRENKQWVLDEQVLRDLKSATPPPVVALDSSVLDGVLQQVDGLTPVTASVHYSDMVATSLWSPKAPSVEDFASYEDVFDLLSTEELEMLSGEGLLEHFSIQAAGGLDRNRGNAEELRHYWTTGEGAAKIRWGTPGDWTRCVRHLSKYLGVRSKGYCQLRHKEALGFYTSTHAKIDKAKSNLSNDELGMTEVTPAHMETPIEDIHNQNDPMFDAEWSPSTEMEALLQDESCVKAMTAAGGLDRNRGNAEKLRRYWTRGKGAAKIRWGTPGDWTRCVRHLSKYMGPRAKGYCQLRHKDALGYYTSTHAKMDRAKHNLSNEEFTNAVIEQAVLTARAAEVRNRFALTAAGEIPTVGDTTVQGVKPSMEFGAEFSIPLVLPEDHESGDKRKFTPNSVEIRELPLPLLWQIKTADGHQGSVVVGRIDYLERIEGGIGNARGVFDTGEYGKEAERLVRNGFLRGVSADLDQFEAKEQKLGIDELQEDDEIEKKSLLISHARVMAVTIVPKPAFQECVIMVVDGTTPSEEEEMNTEDGVYEESVEPTAEQTTLVASGFLEHPIPVTPPRDWFLNPELSKPTPLTIDDSGRVFGHIAAWHVNHIGMPRATKPPRSRSKYAYFHTGVCRTDDGTDVPVGQLTLAGGHAPLQADANAASRHYDDTASAIADVHAGEDAHGIWVAGSLRPDATEAQIRALRASAPSGDWRPIGGSLELVAVCQVNVPGFPIARAMVAGGQVMALVAAGAHEMAMLRTDISGQFSAKARLLSELNSSVDTLDIRGRIARARVDAEFGYIPRDEREKLAKKGIALPDGSYPIRNVEDLKNAIQSYGRANESDRAKVRRHIAKRANELKVRHMIPEEWRSLTTMDSATALSAMRNRIASLTAAAPAKDISEEDLKILKESKDAADAERQAAIDAAKASKAEGNAVDMYDPVTGRIKYTAQTQPRDERGKFRKVLARLKQDLGVAGLQKALVKVQAAEDMEFAGNYAGAAAAAGDLINTIDRLDSGALDATKLENVRTTAKDLGSVIANLPLPFTNQAQKVRYSDLPPALKNLMDDMVSRVEKKIGKKDADIATANLRSFKSGADVYSQSEISSQMATLLRLLT